MIDGKVCGKTLYKRCPKCAGAFSSGGSFFIKHTSACKGKVVAGQWVLAPPLQTDVGGLWQDVVPPPLMITAPTHPHHDHPPPPPAQQVQVVAAAEVLAAEAPQVHFVWEFFFLFHVFLMTPFFLGFRAS